MFFNKMITRFTTSMQENDSAVNGQPISNSHEGLTASPKGRKQIKINACAKLYSELSATKPSLFGGAPKDRGIDFVLDYYDSWDLLDSAVRNRAPIVCLLHGAPGTYNDFDKLIAHLSSKGFRVLAPNFPDYSATYDHSFRHSPRERLDYLLEFFKAIKVDKVEMLIGHCSAIYTMFELLNQSLISSDGTHSIKVKSLGLFSTPSYNLPRTIKVTPIRLFALKSFENPVLRPVVLILTYALGRLYGVQNSVDPMRIENLLIAASAVAYSDDDKMVDRLKLVRKFKIPTFLLFGCSDRLISKRYFEQLQLDLGVDKDTQVKHYGENGQLVRAVTEPNELVHVSQFESGGHYVFQKFWREINEDVYEFLTHRVVDRAQLVESTKL